MGGGTLIVLLMLIRLLVRARTAHPPEATARDRRLDRLAWLSHCLLYVAVFGMGASGLIMALQAGLPSIVLGGHGALPADFWVYPVRAVHYALSRLLMALIALH